MSDMPENIREILGPDAPENPWEEMKLLRKSIIRERSRLLIIRAVVAANQYGLPDKEAINLMWIIAINHEPEKFDEIHARMQGIIDAGVEEANKRL